jgi:predicted acyl esterase
MRLEIRPSNVPHFDRNPNTGHPFGQDAEVTIATQTIVHDAVHPSTLELPVVPGVKYVDRCSAAAWQAPFL